MRVSPAAAAIVGVYEHPSRLAPDQDEWTLTAEVAAGALADAGLRPADVDAYFTPPIGVEGGRLGPGVALMMADYLNIHPKYLDESDVGGASFGYYVNRAILAIHAGIINCALITYAAVPRSRKVAIGAGALNELPPVPDSFERIYGIPLVGFYGMLAQRYMAQGNVTSEDLARVAVATRARAAMNPNALYRDLITVDDVLDSPMISSPLHRLDCCVISDGAAAVVVASPELADTCRTRPVWVRGFGEATMQHDGGRGDWVADSLTMIGSAASAAFDMSHVAPNEVDLVMLYDAFTLMVPMGLEGMGFCGPGEAGEFIRAGGIDPGGSLPLNTDGGGLSSNHPGRRGLFLLVEATKQLRHEAGERQIPDVAVATCLATGTASLARRASAVHVLARH